ncbi:MAG: DUF433 domain-containing protein [Cyclobacteriaceae bacterium]
MGASVISVNPNVLGGTPVFEGTRVPVETLFDHLESGLSLEVFLEDFPSVSKDQVTRVLEMAGRVVSARNFQELYESTT